MRRDQIEMEANSQMIGLNRRFALGLISESEFDREALAIFQRCKFRTLYAVDGPIQIEAP